MIFLGAGASKPFGIPTLEEFSQELKNRLDILGHTQVLERIENSLQEFGITADFEALYSILEGVIHPQESVKHAGALTAYLVRSKANLPQSYDYTHLMEDLRKVIYEKCAIGSERFLDVRKCYDKLWQVTANNASSEATIGVPPKSVNIGRVLVTTNYDMSLELYFLEKGTHINDGFDDTGGLVKYYNPRSLLDPYSSEKTILKLHGSIFQFSKDDKVIKTKLDPSSPALPFKIDVGREMMIYPTKEKEILVNPYFSFLSTFRTITWTKLLVIGYSFRDEPVNNAILENMKLVDNSQLIVINPKADEVTENLYANASERLQWRVPRHRLYKFSGNFGSSDAYEYLSRIERVSDNQDPSFDPSVLEH